MRNCLDSGGQKGEWDVNVMGRFVTILMCIVCIVLVPLQDQLLRQQEQLEQYLIAKTAQFQYTAAQTGRITLQEYEKYQSLFSTLQGRYSYEMVLTRSYADSTEEKGNQMLYGEEMLQEQMQSQEEEVMEQMLYGEEKIQGLDLYQEGEMQEHIHTIDCYEGHQHQLSGCEKHQHSGSAVYGGGCYTQPFYRQEYQYHYHADSCMSIYQNTGYLNLPGSMSEGVCSSCRRTIWMAQHSHPCSYCQGELGVLLVKSCGCGYQVLAGSVGTHRHPPYICGKNDGEITGTIPVLSGYQCSCGKIDGWQCGQVGTDTAVCSQILCEIKACQSQQSLYAGEALNSDVVAVWLDGSETVERAECSEEEEAGKYTVWLSLYAKCDSAYTGNYYRKYCMVEVERYSDEKICEYGHSLETGEKGCPECAGIVTGIKAVLIQKQYHQGEKLKLQLLLQYQDGHQKETAEWTSSFNSENTGKQTVDIYCQGFHTSIAVEVITKEENCSFCETPLTIWEENCQNCYITPITVNAEGTAVFGQSASVKAVVTYRDGHYQKITEGYRLIGFNPYQSGRQQVSIEYMGVTGIAVIVVTEEPVDDNSKESGEGTEKGENVGEKDENEKGEGKKDDNLDADSSMFKLVSQEELELELEINGQILIGEKTFLTFFLKKCDNLALKTVNYWEKQNHQEKCFYTIGGAV